MRTSIAGGIALLSLAACGEPSPSTFGNDFEASMCRWATGCSVFQTEAQCREALVWEAFGRFEYLEQAIAAGRVTFDADAAGRCLNTIEELGCDEATLNAVVFAGGLRSGPAACRDVYVGEVRNYDPCLASEECAGDNAVCGYPPACEEACCVGSCRDLGATPKLGEVCNGECEADAYCGPDPNGGPNSVCQKRGKIGDACPFFDACVADAYCDWNSSRCVARAKAGQPCDEAPCEGGLHCYYLDAEYRCRALPGEGEACEPNNNYPACARVDNMCSGGTCVKLAEPGQSCWSGGCLPYAECDYNGESASCVARASLGEACGAIEEPDGAYRYVSCIGHLSCGEANVCIDPTTPQTCAPPE